MYGGSEVLGDSYDAPGTLGQHEERRKNYKVMLLGESQVGKSALISRFMDHSNFVEEYIPTLMDSYTNDMVVTDTSDGSNREVFLEIKDIGH